MRMMKYLLAIGLLAGTFAPAFAKSADQYYQSAVVHQQKNQFKESVIELKNALKSDPAHTQSRILLGKLYFAAGKMEDAVKELRKARKLNAPREDWLLVLARVYFGQGKYDDLLTETADLSGLSANIKSLILSLNGQVYTKKGDFEQAKQSLNQALLSDAGNDSAIIGLATIEVIEGNIESAEKSVSEVLTRSGKNIQALEFMLKLKLKQKDYKQSKALIERLLEVQPFHRMALFTKISLSIQDKQLDEALVVIKQLKKYYPRAPISFYFQGVVLFQQEKFDEARGALQKILNVVPGHLPSLFLMAKTSYRLAQYESAGEYLNKVLAIRPESGEASLLYAAVQMRNGQPEEAIRQLELLSGDVKKTVQYLSILGSAYYQSGQYQKGVTYLEQAATLNPNLSALQAQLALSQLAAGNTDDALISLEAVSNSSQDIVKADLLYIYALINKKEFGQAEQKALKIVAEKPDKPLSYHLLGMVYFYQEKIDESIAQFQKALKVDPAFTSSELSLAKSLLVKKDLKQAQKHLKNIVRIDPENTQALVKLAEIEAAAGNYNKMESLLIRAENSGKASPEPGMMLARYYLSKNKGKALIKAGQLSKAFPDSVKVTLMLAQIQLANRDVVSAIRNFKNLLDDEPDSLQIHYLLAGAYGLNDQLENALSELNTVLQKKSDYVPALINRAELLIKMKRFDEAMKSTEKIVELLPKQAAGYQLTGRIWVARKDNQQALVWYQKAFEQQPDRKLVMGIYQLKRKLGQNSIATLQQWLQSHEQDAGIRTFLAMDLQGQNKIDAAIAEFDKVLAVNPKNGIALNNMAWIYFDRKDNQKALTYADRALNAAPDSADILDTVGWIKLQSGRIQEGVALLRKASDKNSDNPSIQYHYAAALERASKPVKARAILQKLIDSGKGFPEKTEAIQLLDRLH
jgi:cellulose synthase operon protein C